MAVPGYSIPELLQAIKKIKDIYDAFWHPYKKYSRRLEDFRDELDQLYEALDVNASIYEWTGKQYPGLRPFYNTLQRCKVSLEKQQNVLAPIGVRGSFTGTAQQVLSAFDNDLANLQTQLDHRRLEFMDFKLNLLLQNAHNRAEQPVAAAGGSFTTGTNDDDKELRRKTEELFRIIFQHKRLQSGNVPNASEERRKLDARFQRCYVELCGQVGFSEAARITHISLEDLPSQLSRDRWQHAIESTTGTVRYMEGKGLGYTAPCHAKIDIDIPGEEPLHATSYFLLGRRLILRDAENRAILEHTLYENPRKTFPYSKHRMHNKPLTITFLTDQGLVIKQPRDRSLQGKPVYRFDDDKAYRQFQGDLRSKLLLYELHVESISTIKSGRDGPDAVAECIKLWQSTSGVHDTTISFPALRHGKTRDFELPLKWFISPSPLTETTAQLKLAQDRPPHLRQPSDGVTHAGASMISRFRNRRTSTINSNAPSVPATLASVNTIASQSAFAPKHFVDEVGYLDLKFSCPEEMQEFFRDFEEAAAASGTRRDSAYSSRPASITPTVTTSTTTTPSDFSVFGTSPVNTQSQFRKAMPVRTNTAGAMTLSPSATLVEQDEDQIDPKAPEWERQAQVGDLNLPPTTATGLVPRDEVVHEDDESIYPGSIMPDEELSAPVTEARGPPRGTTSPFTPTGLLQRSGTVIGKRRTSQR
jgi:hypothetical protein